MVRQEIGQGRHLLLLQLDAVVAEGVPRLQEERALARDHRGLRR